MSVVWACAIMPNHVHLVVAFHDLKIESLIIQLKGQATRALTDAGIHPFGHIEKPTPKCFARGEWKGFLDPDDVALKTYLYSRAQSVMGGTSQIQKNIVATRILGLPTG